MKKIFSLILAAMLALSLAACTTKGNTTENSASPSENTRTNADDTTDQVADSSKEDTIQAPDSSEVSNPDPVEPRSKTLVVYFSRTGEQYGVGNIDKGNTAVVAEMIAEMTGADTFEILPKEDYYPYTYKELTDVAKKEQNENARPEIKDEVPDIAGYDTIFIGAPVWWGDWPMIMYTFFEENADALAGKTLIPFSTHAGSGLSGFDKKLASALPNSTVGKGLAISGADAQNKTDSVQKSVAGWLKDLGYEE